MRAMMAKKNIEREEVRRIDCERVGRRAMRVMMKEWRERKVIILQKALEITTFSIYTDFVDRGNI